MAAKLQDAQLQQIASRLKALRELSDYTIADAAGKLGSFRKKPTGPTKRRSWISRSPSSIALQS